jgi:transcription elongation GreA/GreB family factor
MPGFFYLHPMHRQEIKEKLYIHLQQLIKGKIEELKKAIASAKESRDNDTKSSVGDKHETSRALIQTEIDKLEIQLDKTLHSEKELSTLHPEKKQGTVEKGSLVFTRQETYFISIGIGKVELGTDPYYCISLASPVGKLLQGKKTGDEIELNGRKIEIKEII